MLSFTATAWPGTTVYLVSLRPMADTTIVPLPFGRDIEKFPLVSVTPATLPSPVFTTAPITGSPLSSTRSEEHTSELQSRQYLVCRLLLEKKKQKQINH